MIKLLRSLLAATVLACGLAGCVSPGQVDPTLLNRYQQAMERRSPQMRQGGWGLAQLRPTDGTTGPELRVFPRQDDKPAMPLRLDEAVMRALANNMEIRVVSYDPAISREEMVRAAAEFDWAVFGEAKYQQSDSPTFAAGGPFALVGITGVQADSRSIQAGVRKKTVLGGAAALAWTMTRTWDSTTLSALRTRYTPTLALEISQPLLRDAWPEFNLARLRIAQINRKASEAAFRQRVEEIITEVIRTYWQLVQARRDVMIQEMLLKDTEDTLRGIIARLPIDATTVEVKQAEASVETRRAVLIRARKLVGDAQDRLAQLQADAQLNLLADYEVIPVTSPSTTAVKLDVADQLLLALQHNPQLEQARLAIAAQAVAVRAAENQTLPKLDLTASSTLAGVGTGFDSSMENLSNGRFLSYALGLVFEYPLGNRARLAELRRLKFEKLKVITELQNAADLVAAQIKERIRQIETSYEELRAQAAAVDASREQLNAINDRLKIRGQLTPEFLLVKLQAQETLAAAARAEIAAVVEYNVALADLARVNGTALQVHRVQMGAAAGEATWPVPSVEVITPATIPAMATPPRLPAIDGIPSRPVRGTATEPAGPVAVPSQVLPQAAPETSPASD